VTVEAEVVATVEVIRGALTLVFSLALLPLPLTLAAALIDDVAIAVAVVAAVDVAVEAAVAACVGILTGPVGLDILYLDAAAS
jgi:hypothetical protein